MNEQQNNLRIIFTPKANSALDVILKNFNLVETPEEFIKRKMEGKSSKIVIIDRLAKEFSRAKISEKELTNSLQKDLEVSQQTAEQISKEIINKIVPFLEKIPEEKFKDSVFVEELSKKIWGNENKIEEPSTLSKIKPPIDVIETLNKNYIKKPEPEIYQISDATSEDTLTKIEKAKEILKKRKVGQESEKPVVKKSTKPDTYREPIA